jgi:pimeloyl-ACP methyl ester carboxylesterase
MSSPSSDRVLVFVHAFPMGAGMWRQQLGVAPGWRIVTVSLPGFDGRRPLIQERTIDAYARDVLAALDAEGIERAVFCGLSMGGYVTFGILREAAHRVAGLILADTRTSTDTPERNAARLKSIELARTSGPSAIADDMMPAILGPTTHAQRPHVAATVRALIEAQSGEAIAAAIEAMINRPDSAATIATVTVPTTIIVGEEDAITTPADAEQMHRAIAGSTLVTIPRAGHMSNLETPDEFNAALRSFVANFKTSPTT